MLLVAASLCLGCVAGTAFRRGEKAEKREDWDGAVVEYVRALAKNPGNTRYSVALSRARLKASAVHFERGKAYLKAGLLKLATEEFEQTIFLDPANQFAADELRRTRETIRRNQMTPTEIELAKKRAKKESLAPPMLSPKSNLPIVLKFKDQPIGKIYDALSKASGVNFLYDERLDLKETKTVDIAGVTFEKAMDILMLQNKHFFKIIDENTILLAQDNRQKRQEYEDRVIRTFYLSNGETKQVNTVLRQLLEARKVAENPELNSLTVKDSPEVIEVAEKIIAANDKAKAELVIDVELLELNRTKLQDLGVDLTTKALSVLFQGGDVSVPLNNLKQLEFQGNWSIGPIPGFLINFAKTYTDSKTIAKPQVRVTEGEKAEIHIGDRIPIPSTTFNTSNTVGGNIVPVTSFTYTNVGIQISLEPRVHHNREITLKLSVEVSSLAGTVQGTGGVSQPIIGTRQIQTVIRLKDGETNMLAGLIREEDSRSLAGVPGISDVPFLNRLFGRNTDTSQKTDIVLTITPHITRIPDITEADLTPLWVGTEERIKLRRPVRNAYGESPFASEEGEESETVPTIQVPPTPRPVSEEEEEDDEEFEDEDEFMDEDEFEDDDEDFEEDFDEDEPGGLEGDAGGRDEDRQPPPSVAQIVMSSPQTAYEVGDRVTVEVRVVSGQNIGSIPFHLRFNPQVLEYIEPGIEGDFLSSDGAQTVFVATPVADSGEIVVGLSRVGAPEGASGRGTLATFTFLAVGPGQANFSFTGAAVKDPNANNLPAAFNVVPVTVAEN